MREFKLFIVKVTVTAVTQTLKDLKKVFSLWPYMNRRYRCYRYLFERQ